MEHKKEVVKVSRFFASCGVTSHYATLCNQQSQRGSLEESFIADIVIVNEKKEVMYTIVHGNILYDKEHKG